MKEQKNMNFQAKKGFIPLWATKSYIGGLDVSCKFCSARHFLNEPMRCCDGGVVTFPLSMQPPKELAELLDCRTDRGRRHLPYISRINTMYSFASRECIEERIPGRGVPITKVRGSYAHTLGSVRMRVGESAPRYGTLYALDNPEEATQFRLANVIISKDIDEDLIRELGIMFQLCNRYASLYKHMKDILQRE